VLQGQIADLETIIVPTEAQALLLENTLIKEHQPRFNIRLRDDKSYPQIAVTLGEPFPRVLVVRRVTFRAPATSVLHRRGDAPADVENRPADIHSPVLLLASAGRSAGPALSGLPYRSLQGAVRRLSERRGLPAHDR